EFLGRNDHQVKINGYRIELGEIETHLTTHPKIKDAVVTATANHLTAYLTPTAPDHATDDLIADIRHTLTTTLPDYMIPRTLTLLDTLPLTPNGKIDRTALPTAVVRTGAAGSDEPADPDGGQPRNDIERRLRDVWTAALGIETCGIHDVFGDLGGDSLIALRVISKAADSGLSITPRQFFERPTIAELARVATIAAPRTADEAGADVTGEAALLPAQAMLLAGLDGSVARHHNYALFFELDEPMNKVALRVALRTLVARHDAFRTGFVHGTQGWRQRVAAADDVAAVPLEWLDLAGVPEEEQSRVIEEAAERAQQGFRLEEPPLLRVLYFDRGRARRAELLLIAHWLVVDNFSLRLVLDELLTAHAQIAEEGQATLLPPTVPAAMWARELAGLAGRSAAAPELAGTPEAAPGLGPTRRSAVLTHESAVAPEPGRLSRPGTTWGVAREAATLIEVLDASAVGRLRGFARGAATMGDVLLAALARSARACGFGKAIRVDVDGHGRAAALPGVSAVAADLSRTVGRLSVRYPLEVPAVADSAEAVRTVVAVRSAVPNGGLEHALAAYGGSAHADDTPVPAADFAFNYLGAVDELYAIPGLRPSAHRPGPLVHADTPLRYRFEVLCGTVDGELLIGLTCPAAQQPAAKKLLGTLMTELSGPDGRDAPDRTQSARGSALAATFRHWL
ncbi:condensation domain-containing protein, partial [Streptomyces sp.]|uniref:condensation domain-containing protein n=1 Tax=Streptomyces sp. TaxID=1931 RepID=UPI002F407686